VVERLLVPAYASGPTRFPPLQLPTAIAEKQKTVVLTPPPPRPAKP
jgi:hypothetical protein